MWHRRWIMTSAIVTVLGIVPIWSGTASSVPPNIPRCKTAGLRVWEYNTLVGAGHVNDLFWIRNVSSESCSIAGYPSIGYQNMHGRALPVKVGDERGNDGNFVGGVKSGFALPDVILQAKGAVASFWVDGLDIPAGNPAPSCIDTKRMIFTAPHSSGSTIAPPLKSNGFFWCGGVSVFPVVAGRSGSLTARALSYFFGVPSIG
jgi:hypothetical protein